MWPDDGMWLKATLGWWVVVVLSVPFMVAGRVVSLFTNALNPKRQGETHA